MLPPVQNQELVQRSHEMSNLRSHEQGKLFGDLARSMAEMQRLEELKNSTVQKNEETEATNPDGSGNKQEQQQKKNEQEEAQPETNTPAGRPLKLEGGDVLDIMA
ncbi:MAG: hypothetical protein LBC85_03770 [Fibromonadaceae bacterium]|jgi:Sec-independent protein translocase protein TatA|nr:hypothetical protein [Fibromonadaceae bacterium]